MIISSNLIIITQQNHQYNICFDVWSLAVYPGDQKNQFRPLELASSSFYEYRAFFLFVCSLQMDVTALVVSSCVVRVVCVCVCVCVCWIRVCFSFIFLFVHIFFYSSFVDFCGNVLRGCGCVCVCVCVLCAFVSCALELCARAIVLSELNYFFIFFFWLCFFVFFFFF